ncbi:MAG: LytTR family DNA-binding domain-containing protein [Eubacteriales bacterium]|nr:LytTR family DNA-binding domain-containing protein [Eubacteriales bacterium]
MIYSINYSKQIGELERLKGMLRDAAAFAGDEEWKWFFTPDGQKLQDAYADFPVLDLSCLDVTGKEGIARAEELRKRYAEVYLMVIADMQMSPMQYLKPSIMPASLLVRPYTDAQMEQVLREFVSAFMGTKEEVKEEEQYVIETKQGRTFIPVSKISYFEARQKKIFIRVEAMEYDSYDTIDGLMKKLPPVFVRCHRSYIINRNKIEHVQLSENLVYLRDGSAIPISRSYRADMKAL